MAYVEFYMDTSGNDLNSGSTTATTSAYTSTAGNFDGTSLFTPTDGQTTSSFVSVGDYIALYNTGDTAARCIAKVTAVGAGVNGTITIDTTIKYGTVPTSNSGSRACKRGGALASLAITAANAAFNTGTVPQATRINAKFGTYASAGTNRTLAMAGVTTTPLWWRGFKTTAGDQDTNNVPIKGTDIPDFTSTSGTVTVSGIQQIFSSISFTGAPSATELTISGNSVVIESCLVENTGNNRAITTTGNGILFARSWFKATTSASAVVNIATAGNHQFIGCWFTGGTTCLTASVTFTAFGCIFDGASGDAISLSASSFGLINCSLYGAGGTSGNGINMTTAPTALGLILNCHIENFTGSGKFAINNSSGTNTIFAKLFNNTGFNNTASTNGITESFAVLSNDFTTLASAGFINPPTNYGMLSVGQNLGFPGSFETTNTFKGFFDPGAVQGGHVNRSRSFSGF
jgi:hypothetical protein